MLFLFDLTTVPDKDIPKVGVYIEVVDLFSEAIEYLANNIVRADKLTDYGKEQILWLVKAYWEEGTEESFNGHSDYAILYSMLTTTAEGIVKNMTIAPSAIKRYEETIPRLQTFLNGSWVARTVKQKDTTKEVS